MTLRPPVPDLLMRFTPTPYRLISNSIVIETNDLEILDQFDEPFGMTALASIHPAFNVRIVRDALSAEIPAEPHTLDFGALRVTMVGTATVLVFDRELFRIFGFVSSQASARTIVEKYLFGALLSGDLADNTLIPQG